MQANCSSNVLSVQANLFASRLSSSNIYFGPKICSCSSPRRYTILCKANNHQNVKKKTTKKKEKENVWSMENKLLDSYEEPVKKREVSKKKSKSNVKKMKAPPPTAIVTAAMPVETEKVLQTQEPVIKPTWETFVSSISGYWNGVGAAFSPITAQMEPLSLGKRNEYLYDCYTLSKVESVDPPSIEGMKKIHRKVNWVTANPLGEQELGKITIQKDFGVAKDSASDSEISSSSMDENFEFSTLEQDKRVNRVTEGKKNNPSYESKVSRSSEVMEEEVIDLEPGLVFFEDGSYSRGPVVMNVDDTQYFLPPTYIFEQCLVRGGHKRLRVVHTISIKDGGVEVELLRLAVYEEEWIGPSNLDFDSESGEKNLVPISKRNRIMPPTLVGSWKVFEISATAVLDDSDDKSVAEKRPSYVFLCMETLKKRSLPEVPIHFGDEDALDMQDITVLWLPGGITAYVDIKEDGILSIGVGWYSDDGTNLVMERDYGSDGKLLEVRSKTEVKRRWSDGQL